MKLTKNTIDQKEQEYIGREPQNVEPGVYLVDAFPCPAHCSKSAEIYLVVPDPGKGKRAISIFYHGDGCPKGVLPIRN